MNCKLKKYSRIVVLLWVAAMFYACGNSSGQDRDTALDSLFLGLSLGMDRQAFFDSCWRMNNRKMITQGPTNQNVEYIFDSLLDNRVIMRFYPNFYKDKVYEMPVVFMYEAWAPWNKQFSSDSLFEKLVPVFKNWYGDDFQIIEHKTQGTVYARIDGKRRINLFRKDDQYVQAVYTDLRMAKALKEESENEQNK